MNEKIGLITRLRNIAAVVLIAAAAVSASIISASYAGPAQQALLMTNGCTPGYATPAPVQGNSAAGATASPTVSITFTGSQRAGDLNVIAIGWLGTTNTVTAVSDSNGNNYFLVPSLTVVSGVSSQVVYYAPNIASGSNTVTVTFSASMTTIDLRIEEYSGIASSGALDTSASGESTTGTTIVTSAATTRQSSELLVGAVLQWQRSAPTPTGGYTNRVASANGNTIEDRVVTNTGSYTASATQSNSGWWIINMAAFKAAVSGCAASSSSSSGGSSSSGSSSSSSSGGSSSGGTTLLTYLNSLRGSGKVLSGQWADHFAGAAGGTYGNFLDQFLPASGATPANITVNDHSSGNTGKAPAILGVSFNSAGSCGSAQTLAQGIATANGQMAAGGIVMVLWGIPDPAQYPNCVFSGVGSGTTFPGVITPGNAYYNTYMYGHGCTAASPCGGVWALGQALLSVTPGHKMLTHILAESDLAQGSEWWGTNGVNNTSSSPRGPNNADYVALYKQTEDYLTALGVTNLLWVYSVNNFGGAFSQNDPGTTYAPVYSVDLYGPTTQAGVISDMNNSAVGYTYGQSRGGPVISAEQGVFSYNNSAVATFTYDNSIWDQAIQGGSTISNYVGGLTWNQNWCLNCQLGAANYMNNTIPRSAVPPLVN